MIVLVLASALAADCPRAAAPPVIDGVLDDPAWAGALRLTAFRQHWNDDAPSTTPIEARLVWDADALYLGATVTDADLYADVTEHDGRTFDNDVVELFLKPSADSLGYYELEISPANTVLDLYLPSRGSGGYRRWATAHPFHVTSAVVPHGTLNDATDRDEGYTVELRLPFADLAPTGGAPSPGDTWRFELARYDYSVLLERPELTSTAPLTERDFHRYEEWDPLTFR